MSSQLEIEQELQSEYDRFVEFGSLLTKQMRRYLVQYIKFKVGGKAELPPELNDRYFQYFKQALQDIFGIDNLLQLSERNQKIKKQIVVDIIYWLRKAHSKSKLIDPYAEEKQRLGSWSVTPLKAFVLRYQALLAYIAQQYSREELDTAFFANRFDKYIGGRALDEMTAEEGQAVERLLRDILAQWDALLYAKTLHFELSKLSEEKETFVDLLSEKVSEYYKIQQLVNPFSEYLGWDMSRELWQKTSFDLLGQYSDLLENEQSIKELADLLGKMREAEIEMQEETFEQTIIRQEWTVDEQQRTEIVGTHESNDLTNMLSSEAAYLSDPDLELAFLKKYADQSLLTFRYEDRKITSSEDHFIEVNQRVRQKEKGPFIICIDTSESMTGRPEQIAKIICLGILKMAMKEDRRAYLINFSRGIQTIDLYDIANSVDEIAAFLSMSFYGGTDATLALTETFRQLNTHNYEDADVLMVSDFIMYKISDDILASVKYFQQNKNTQFHSLTLSAEANQHILGAFDTNWMYDPRDKGIIRSLSRGLADIKERY